ncbi:MAG: glycosyltransferase family A protein [Porphyromonas sp.]|nr:glycosyltransferase family A protein [Porphyromonas sp.]
MDNTHPKISVVIPLYNKEKTIKKTIQSVLDQDFKDFELIVVNDGSKDKSATVVQSIDDSRIRLIDKPNGGVSSARNRGIVEAKSDYIAFLDADDYWLPNHLTEINNLIEEYGDRCSVFTTNFTREFSDGTSFPSRNDLKKGQISNYFKTICKGAIIHSSSVAIKKEALLHIGMFNENYTHGEDIDLWNRLARKYEVAYSPDPSSIYRITNEGSVLTMNYDREAAKNALKGVSTNPHDLYLSCKRYLFYCIKRLINYKPQVRKP